MQTYALPARTREVVGKIVAKLRRSDVIPAVLYGHGVKNMNLELDSQVLTKVYRQAGASSLIDLQIEGQPVQKVLIHGVQRHPTRQTITHVDLYQVKMTEKLETEIELNFVGESAAVKESGGIFVRAIDKVKVECLPGDLVPSIDVDISALKTFDDHIRIVDIVLPKGITILTPAEEIVATVTPPRSDAELEALSEKVETDVQNIATEAEEKKKKAEADAAAEAEAEKS